MPTDNFTIVAPTNLDQAHGYGQIAQWASMANGDVGAPYPDWGNYMLTMQVEGTFGSGGSVSLEGNNDGTNYHILLNAAGTAATLTSAGIISIQTRAANVRPHVTAGDGATLLTVTLLATRISR